MTLKYKTFVYSLVLGFLIMAMVLSYMIVMLPPLYIDYQKEKAETNSIAVHDSFITNLQYDKVRSIVRPNDVSVSYDFTGHEVHIANMYFKAALIVKDAEIIALFKKFNSLDKNFAASDLTYDIDVLKNKLHMLLKSGKELFYDSFEIKDYETVKTSSGFDTGNSFSQIREDTYRLAFTARKGDEAYATSYIITKRDSRIYVSISPRVESRVSDILPVVLSSVPMLIGVLVLILIVMSGMYSKSIITPILKIRDYAKKARESSSLQTPPALKVHDEITELRDELEKLYVELKINYDKLKKNTREKELFLRSSSHNLKTPISAILLLINSIENGNGKYKDVNISLPEIKKQTKKIERVVNEITYLHHLRANPNSIKIPVRKIIEEILHDKRIMVEEQKLHIRITGDKEFTVDMEMFKISLENVIINAIKYTEKAGRISIQIADNQITIKNAPANISEKIVRNFMKPSDELFSTESLNGLGLYLAQYYLDLLGYDITISSATDTVIVEISKNAAKNIL